MPARKPHKKATRKAPKKPPSTAKKRPKNDKASVLDRANKALHLKRSGLSYDEIAASIDGFSSRGAVHNAVTKLLDSQISENAEQYRKLNALRLERLLAAVWVPATSTKGGADLKASEQARRIIADLSKLMGANMPEQIEHEFDLANLEEWPTEKLLGLLGGNIPDELVSLRSEAHGKDTTR